MPIRPLQDWALIRLSQEKDITAGGIVIPDAAKEKPQEGEVLAIGEGRFKEKMDKKGHVTEKNFVKTTLKPGNKVLYEKYASVEVPLEANDLVMVREDDILGILEK